MTTFRFPSSHNRISTPSDILKIINRKIMTGNNTDTKGYSKPSKASGKLHQLKGDLKVSLGRAFGAPEMQRSGAQERAAGYAEYQAAAGQGSYTKERMTGKHDQVVGSVTGDGAQTQGGLEA